MPTEDELLQEEINRARAEQSSIALPTMARGSAEDGGRPGFLGLLGEVLGGGQAPGYQLRGQEESAAGSRALLNFGINMLLASGPQRVRPDLFSAAAHGLQGAQQSIDLDQRRGQARAEADYGGQLEQAKLTQLQSREKIERLKTLIPLLELQDKRKETERIRNLPPPWATPSASNTSQSAPAPLTPYVASNLPEGVTAEEDQLVRTVWGEARGEPVEGQRAVAAVVKNRMAGGKSVQDVVFAPGQFEPWNNPKEREKLVALSPSDPQYQAILNGAVRPVMRGEVPDPTGGATYFYSPTAQAALKRETPGFAVGREPKAVIGRHNFYGDAPPASTATRPPQQPPQADVAPTGVQVSGPGALPGQVQPPGPAVAGNVAAMMQGMIGAGADPNTLAPGRGGGAGGAQVAQVGQPGVTPSGAFVMPLPDEPFEAYRKRNQIPPTPEQQRELAGIQAAKRAAMSSWQAASTQDGKAKAAADYAAAEKAEGEAIGKIGSANETRLFDIWKDANTANRNVRNEIEKEQRAAALKAQQDAENHRRTLETGAQKGEQDRLTEMAKTENSYVLTERKRFGEERDGSRAAIDDLQMLRALSQAAGTSTPLENIVVGDRTGRDYLVQYGMGTEAAQKKWGAQQAFEAAVNAAVIQLRKGVSMGALTDRDLQFLQRMAPSLLQQPETRASIISMLEQAQHRKLQYTDLVEQLWDGGKGMSWGTAKREAQKMLPDYLPSLPPEYASWDAATRQQWKDANLRPGQLLRGPDGTLSVYQPQRRQ